MYDCVYSYTEKKTRLYLTQKYVIMNSTLCKYWIIEYKSNFIFLQSWTLIYNKIVECLLHHHMICWKNGLLRFKSFCYVPEIGFYFCTIYSIMIIIMIIQPNISLNCFRIICDIVSYNFYLFGRHLRNIFNIATMKFAGNNFLIC